jgi:UDP-N-acetylmuramyl pentapeptide phosphotransferase/UDP-N-acetylglucosamine-1-phosphate transferase
VDLRRLRHGEWIAGVSGAVLLVSLFLDWYSAGGGAVTANAWESFSVTDVVLAVAALFGLAVAVGAATQRSAAVPTTVGSLAVPVAFVAAIVVVIHALSLPDGADGREIGLYIGVVATLGVLIGAWRTIGDQSFPKGASPQVEVTPLPAPKPRPSDEQ